MTNVQEALISAIELIQCFEAKLTNSQTAHSLPSEKVKRKLRDAISEIEKCEPVAFIDEFGTIVSAKWQELYGDGTIYNIALYKSPQPREWVGISEQQEDGLLNAYLGFAGVENARKLVQAVSGVLKQLNTKG